MAKAKGTKKATPDKTRTKRIAWGESADVFLLPIEKAVKGGRVLRLERRMWGPLFSKRRAPAEIAKIHADASYYAVKIARTLFPEHIIDMTAVQTTKKVGGKTKPTAPRYYSKYYPFPVESREEMHHIRERIRTAHRGKAKKSVVKAEVKAFDKKMRLRYPELIPTVKKIEAAGFFVPHPEMKFTVRRGKIVFYEVELTSIEREKLRQVFTSLLPIAKAMSKSKAKTMLAQTMRLMCERKLGFADKRLSGKLWANMNNAIQAFLDNKIITADEADFLSTLTARLAYAKSPGEARPLLRKLKL